jgi:hypothetical protein
MTNKKDKQQQGQKRNAGVLRSAQNDKFFGEFDAV